MPKKRRRIQSSTVSSRTITPKPLNIHERVEPTQKSPFLLGFIIGLVLLIILLVIYNVTTSTSNLMIKKTITTELPQAPLNSKPQGGFNIETDKPVLEAPPSVEN